jgi:hypothetical protein
MMIVAVVTLLGVGIAVGSLLSSSPTGEATSSATANTTAQSELLKITSQPEEAVVTIDDQKIGNTPLNASVPADDRFDVTIRKEGFQPESFDAIKFDNQSNERLFTNLARKTLEIRVTSPVDGAELTVNGTSFGKLPAGRTRDIEVSWPNDRLMIRLDPPKFEPFVQNIPLSAIESPVTIDPAEADLVPSK